MSQYLPFGKKIVMTNEQYSNQQNIFKTYEYYGIPYGIIDNSQEGEQLTSNKELDRNTATLFISQGKPVPKDLAQRLLQYKAEDESKKIKHQV